MAENLGLFKHKLTNELLRIKKIKGSIATCFIGKPYYLKSNGFVLIDTCICSIRNIERIEGQPLKKQLELFALFTKN